MDNEPEVIREQMAATHASLTDKVETLEHQVVDTVQGATCAVQETVDSVKQAVQESVGAVKDTVASTVESVKETLDVWRQIDLHPWLMLGGAVLAGYVGGRVLGRMEERAESRDHTPGENGKKNATAAMQGLPPFGTESADLAKEEATPGWLHSLGESISPELKQLQGLALGTALGIVREALASSAPHEVSGKLREIIDDMTQKLGGDVIHEPLVKTSSMQSPSPEGASETMTRRSAATTGKW